MTGNDENTDKYLHNAFAYSSEYGVRVQLGKAPDVSEIVILNMIAAAATTSAALNAAKHITINYVSPVLQSATSYAWNTGIPAVWTAAKYITTEYAVPAAKGLASCAYNCYNWYYQPANTGDISQSQAADGLLEQENGSGEVNPSSREQSEERLEAVGTNLDEVTVEPLASQTKSLR